MRRYVYLAGPIAGKSKAQANNWRSEISARLRPHGIIGISPLRCEPLVGRKYKLNYDDPRFGTQNAINCKNWFDTTNCDLVLAYMPQELNDDRPSWGTAMEIAWAVAMGKPVILVSDMKGLVNHPLVAANRIWTLDNMDDAYDTIVGVLGDYAEVSLTTEDMRNVA